MDSSTFQPMAPERETRAGPSLHPLIEALIGRLENAPAQSSAPPADIRAILLALQDATHNTEAAEKESDQPNAPPKFPPLAKETRATLPTPEAAYHLNRAQQTLRLWAMREDGPIRPMRINGRLAWPVADLRRVLGIA